MEDGASVRTLWLWTTRVLQSVRRPLQAGAAYFGIVFALGFVLGTLRALVLAPLLGPTRAVLVEVPVMLTVSWLVCGWLLARFAILSTGAHRVLMGALAFILLMLAEFGVSVLAFGRSVAEYLASYHEASAQIGLAAQLVFAIFPVVRARKPRLKRAGP